METRTGVQTTNIRLFACLLFWFVASAPAHAVAADTPVQNPQAVEAAAKLTEMTGIAISPLLVGGVTGAWKYSHAPEAERLRLPWTAQPWFWGSLLSLGLLFLLSDTIGRTIPPAAKFMDAVQTVESKLALLYASPLMMQVGIEGIQALERAGVTPIANALAAGGPVFANPLNAILGAGLGLFVLGVIWLANQAIHAIVLLCPFGLASAAIRILQFAVLGVMLVAAAIHPFLGVVIALLLILVSTRVAGWSFRLGVFGTVMAWDLLWFRRNQSVDDSVLAFSGRGLPVPPRTLGWLRRGSSGLELAYRPWLILSQRRVALTNQGWVLTHGLFFSQIHKVSPTAEVPIIVLPPRYRGSEASLAVFAGCSNARPSPLKGGVFAAINWFRRLLQPNFGLG